MNKPIIKYIHGFSLIELSISLAVFSLILLSLSSSLENIQSASSSLVNNNQQSSKLLRVIELISQDVRAAGTMGCSNENYILYQSSFMDANSYLYSNFASREKVSPENIFSKLQLIYSETQQINLSAILKEDLIKPWLIDHNTCQILEVITPYKLSDEQNKIYANHQVSKIHKVNYFVNKKSNSWTLYRQQLSSNNNLYSRPLLSDIVAFDVIPLTKDGFQSKEEIIDWQSVIAMYIYLATKNTRSTSNSLNEPLSLSRLIPLLNNQRYQYVYQD